MVQICNKIEQTRNEKQKNSIGQNSIGLLIHVPNKLFHLKPPKQEISQTQTNQNINPNLLILILSLRPHFLNPKPLSPWNPIDMSLQHMPVQHMSLHTILVTNSNQKVNHFTPKVVSTDKKKSKAHKNISNRIIAYMICKTGFWMKQRKYGQKIRNPFPYLAEIEATTKATMCI